MRGSHRWGLCIRVADGLPGADGDTLPDIDGNEADYDIESYELEPGDMLGHHHLTARNGSTRPRCSKPPRLSS